MCSLLFLNTVYNKLNKICLKHTVKIKNLFWVFVLKLYTYNKKQLILKVYIYILVGLMFYSTYK